MFNEHVIDLWRKFLVSFTTFEIITKIDLLKISFTGYGTFYLIGSFLLCSEKLSRRLKNIRAESIVIYCYIDRNSLQGC